MNSASELGAFLKSRRSRVTPGSAGLPVIGRRRVAGLRREEVAELAGVSAVYYTRLEQGRARNPSDAVLDALARVLRLDPTERAHLYDLARRAVRRAAPPSAAGRFPGTAGQGGFEGPGDTGDAEAVPGVPVREDLRRLLAAVGAVPAYLLGPAMDVLAANDLAHALLGGLGGGSPGRSNLARLVFLDASARDLFPRWDDVARQTVGFLRLSAGRRPGDARLGRVVTELSRRSPEFRELWAAQEVREKSYGTKSFRHPLVGDLDLAYETLSLPGDEGRSLVVFTAPDPRAEGALRLLGSWTARPAARPSATDPPSHAARHGRSSPGP
ncbi:helix-turn-helix transcriptional regulator [Streptomyces sp. S07_1.15]|uniref:helix-turn-helix transcriptional regulator n=1 Tax=Streptomyces sp. S07_1.15 TaxID=2873925 RepID=UPI001D13BE2D|nr:helix-turn-helix transcriptional regulator [Streptomyces sp. S07_1.15]MCC3651937.1 helix-turn-helix transcriptional regulator [Streptomyces sp. S07_1.15]